MDGTLLDLRFDTHFWTRALPERYAGVHGLSEADARARLEALFERTRHQLEFYCLDWWERETGVDIVALKVEHAHMIRYRPSVRAFLERLRYAGKETVIVTNAHPESFRIKQERTGIDALVDAIESAHDFRAPKESPEFWERLAERRAFEPARTLLVDDNLRALAAAAAFGVAHLRAVRRPDSGLPPLAELPYAAIDDFAHVLPGVEEA